MRNLHTRLRRLESQSRSLEPEQFVIPPDSVAALDRLVQEMIEEFGPPPVDEEGRVVIGEWEIE